LNVEAFWPGIPLSSVSITVQKEDIQLHPDLEFWTYTHC